MYDIADVEPTTDKNDGAEEINKFLEEFRTEYLFARDKHKGFSSFHEGYAVIKEEFDELWDEIRKQKHNEYAMAREAIQVGAMVLAYLVELLPTFDPHHIKLS